MQLRVRLLTFSFLFLGFLQVQAQQNFGSSKYVTYTDTGYVFFTQPHFLCYFVSSNKKTIEETLTQGKFLYYTGVYNENIKDFYFENIDKDSANLIIKTKAILYAGKSSVQKDLVFFRAVVNVKALLSEVKFKVSNYVGESLRFKNREVKLYRIINTLGLSYNFTYIPLREGE